MFSKRLTVCFFLFLAVLFYQTGLIDAQGIVFTDSTNLFQTQIRDHWVYQSHHSTTLISVFYGEGDYDLLYFENFEQTLDDSVQKLAERSLDLYEKPGGLNQFQLQRPLIDIDLAGQPGLSCVYTYEDERGNKLWEYRIFAMISNQIGFSLALSSDSDWVCDNALIDDMLEHWRWLF